MRLRLNHPHLPFFVPALFLLVASVACGGGHKNDPQTPAPTPTAFSYTDPTGTGWRLVRDASSTPTRLVLSLVGPAGLKARGVGFNLQADAAVRFGAFANTWQVEDTGVFQLKNVAPDADNPPPSPEPVLMAAGVKPGNLLTVGLFQKDRRATAKVVSSSVLRIALELDKAKAETLAVGSTLTLSVPKARMMAEDIGTLGDGIDMRAKAHLEPIQVAVGTLKVQ